MVRKVISTWSLLFVALAVAHADVGPAAEAKAILAKSGVKGGVIVHLGCRDGALTVALRVDDRYLVQGLDRDPVRVQQARATIRKAGVYGPVSADRLIGNVLPYTDDTVNLLVAENLGNVPMSEIMRVLVPHGVVCVRRGGGWTQTVKPRPEEMDEWTHYLHGPDGNAVSEDRMVGFLRRYQWTGRPRYGRHHDFMSSASAMVSANGRIFSIFDHGSPFSIQLPAKWQLVARDAFNGAVLWRRDMGPWFSQLQRLKSGPADLPRRLVAVGDTVYATLALNAPVTALDAATGTTVRVYAGTKTADEIICSDGALFVVVNRQGFASDPAKEWSPGPRLLMALDAASERKLWEREFPWIEPGSLAVDGRRAVLFDGQRVIAMDRASGRTLWQSNPLGAGGKPVPIYFSPCLVLYRNVVLFSGADPDAKPYHADHGQTMYAFAADTGKLLWQAPHPPSGYRSAEDILVANGLVWTADVFNSRELRSPQTGTVWGRDPLTGEVKVKFGPDVDTHWFHHRCHRAKATEKYLLTSRTGIEFIDTDTHHWTCHHWVRGACLYGIMPANGMIYTPPHPCACYLESKLYGFNALAARSPQRQAIIETAERQSRLERGPAYGSTPVDDQTPTDWPTLRHDSERSGCTPTRAPAEPSPAWETKLGGRLSSPVVAGGRVYVARIDEHEVVALDADSGKRLWQFTAGARVDSPPTIWRGRALFGSADGYVYSLRADDGRLMWRYRAAPADLRMGAFNQLESVWPVHGSVLVLEVPGRGPELWCVAGRSMFLDGGLRLLRLNPVTGEKIAERVLDDKAPGSDENLQTKLKALNMPVALPDVLVSDGKYVYMRSQPFDLDGNRLDMDLATRGPREQKGERAHLFCPTGLLDDVWWHRSYWVFGRVWKSGAGGYYLSGRFAPAGRPMVVGEGKVYAFGRKPQYYRWTGPMEYMLYSADCEPKVVSLAKPPPKGKSRLGTMPPNTIQTNWKKDAPVLVRGMALAGDTLFIAGPPDLIHEPKTFKTFNTAATQALLRRQEQVLQGAEGALLWAVSAASGEKLAEQKLPALPVFDGLIAAGGRLYMTTTDGRIVAMD